MKPQRKLQKTAGALIALAAAGAAALLWFAVTYTVPSSATAPSRATLLGIWGVLYVAEAPAPWLLSTAIAVAFLLIAGIALADRHISLKSRRSANPAQPLAPRIVMARTRGVYAGPVTLTVLIPAHNEAASLPLTLASLLAQSQPPQRIIVVADNCTDATAGVARAAGVEVLETVRNSQKKAGALNQALKRLLPGQGDNDLVMVMDADTLLDDGFLASAADCFTRDRALMAVGGLFYGERGHGLLGQFQRNEYIRYARDMRRRRGRVFVLTGTASVFRPAALRAVAENRGTALPGVAGDVYDTWALTEDNELTIALKSLGGLMVSPSECAVVTELMPTWRTLWAQRLRWQRGALENLGAYGLTPPTARYWAQQFGLGYGVIALSSYLLLILLTVLALDTWIWFPFWLGLGALFSVERVVTVWHGGWRARLLALTVVPELVFDMFLNVVYVKGIIDMSVGREASWKHLAKAG
ncbi:MAG TPA: glycosyltransferase family 2 protein [Arthrobacter sp.]|jgi:cellulose synthase/poly-beta-1,6-N-acetylglucosamine synthase-like glycosyltransferase|uniref:glycosyltransferase family 2 protein n=1 Tax=Arthrobacter sp. TaxID=1667 RepID=UPI002F3E4FBD